MRRRIVVVGGGITGLVAAREVAADHDVLLLEQSDRLGGKIATTELRGRKVDLGPDAFITRNPAALELCEALGLGEDLLPPASSSAAIWSRGKLRRFPDGLVLGIPTNLRALRRSGIVSFGAGLRAGLDVILPRRCAPAELARLALEGRRDPTVDEIVGARLGGGVLAALVDPLLGGINAGSTATLSFAATVPGLVGSIAGRRSLVRALGRVPGSRGDSVAPGATAGPAATAAIGTLTERSAASPSSPLFVGLRGGLEQLVARLVSECRRLGVDLWTGRHVTALGAAGAGAYLVEVGNDTHEADGVVLAVPAYVAAPLVEPLSAELAEECQAIPYAGVAVVTFVWPRSAWPAGAEQVLGESGVLVPRSEDRLITAASFTSTKWPRSAGPGEIVVRASAGRYGDDRALRLDDPALVAWLRHDLELVLGITEAPLEVLVCRWPDSFPQYVSGHLARGARIDALARRHSGLALAGAAYHGIGLPACVEDARRAA